MGTKSEGPLFLCPFLSLAFVGQRFNNMVRSKLKVASITLGPEFRDASQPRPSHFVATYATQLQRLKVCIPQADDEHFDGQSFLFSTPDVADPAIFANVAKLRISASHGTAVIESFRRFPQLRALKFRGPIRSILGILVSDCPQLISLKISDPRALCAPCRAVPCGGAFRPIFSFSCPPAPLIIDFFK